MSYTDLVTASYQLTTLCDRPIFVDFVLASDDSNVDVLEPQLSKAANNTNDRSVHKRLHGGVSSHNVAILDAFLLLLVAMLDKLWMALLTCPGVLESGNDDEVGEPMVLNEITYLGNGLYILNAAIFEIIKGDSRAFHVAQHILTQTVIHFCHG